MTGHPEPARTDGTVVSRPPRHATAELTSRAPTAAHLECLPLDLSRGGDGLGLDEEGSGVDQLHALQRLTPRCIQVLTLSHLSNLGLAVPGQLQDGL